MNNANCKKSHADFQHVEPHQLAIHDRLRNWARWVVVRPQSKVLAMFKFYRPAQHWHEKEFREPCDLIDAQAVEKLVARLPHTHAFALRWYYVYRLSVGIARKELATTAQGVDKAVRDARQMVLNLSD